MDDYKKIEIEIAKKYGVTPNEKKKSIGDFLIDKDTNQPVNVKSNNVNRKNYSPNIISAKRLLKWLKNEKQRLSFIFVDYREKDPKELEIIKDSGLIPVEHISWECLTIEAQGWGVIQMNKELKVDNTQDRKAFLNGLRKAYEVYIGKQRDKLDEIEKMIADL
jgi:hypothetical protein